MTSNGKPVDLYVRISRIGKRDPERMRSAKDQERDARRFAKSRGLKVGEVIKDEDQSGGTLDRPGLQLVLRRVREGTSGGVVVAYLSRASRDTAQGLQLLDEITRAGGAIWAPNLPDDYTNGDGKMLTTIQLAIDTGYRERKREEFQSAIGGAIANGVHCGNRPPTGYRWRSEEDHHLVPSDAAPVVLEAFERRAAGASTAEVCDFLTASGVRTSQGASHWSRQAVATLLSNDVYLGRLTYGSPPRFVNDHAHEAIVPLDLWHAAQRSDAERQRPPRGQGEFALSGTLRCAACGYSLQATRTSADRGRKRRYRCVGRHAGGRCPAPVSADATRVEAVAEQLLWSLVDDVLAAGEPERADLSRLEAELALAEARLTSALSPDVQDAAGPAWASMVRERREARDEAARALGEARARGGSDDGVDWASLRAEWPTMSPAERRTIFAAAFTLALSRDADGVSVSGWPVGAVEGLSRRGFKREPALRPLDDAPAPSWAARL